MADELPPPATQVDAGGFQHDNCLKILLATDNHIGYAERDPVRGRDSINTFREILELAVENDVDMLLLAGDLFHENKPSRSSLYQTTALLRQYCLGPRPVQFQLISDAGMGLGRDYDIPLINYEDENMNIGLPVFSIHGNHDDPQGTGSEGALAALDLLAASGLINYFGRQDLPGAAVTDEEAREQGIQVKPLLIQKGDTKLALYGIGNMRDERFCAEMRKNHISLFKPTETPDEWFNLLLIHQNRATHNPKAAVPEDGFGDDVDLIVWGHEHDCRIQPEPITGKQYHISQPGSSIATSLAEGESKQKHVGLLRIQDRGFNLQQIPLRSVRPFVIDEINLNDAKDEGVELENRVQVSKFLKAKVEELIKKATDEWDDLHKDDIEPEERMLPLIRLRVAYEGHFETGNPQRFGQEFAQRVANPRDIVSFARKKKSEPKSKVTIDQPEGDIMDVDEEDEDGTTAASKIKVETLVHEYLQAQQLEVIAENGMSRAVDDFVEKDDTTAIKDFIKAQLEERYATLGEKKKPAADDDEEQSAEEDSDEEITNALAAAKMHSVEQIEQHGIKAKSKAKAKGKGKSKAAQDDDSEDSFGQMSEDDRRPAPAAKKGKAKAKSKELFLDEDSDDVSVASSAASGKKKAPAKKPAAKKATAKSTKASSSKQAELTFAPARGKNSSRTAASKAKKSMTVELSSDDDDEDAFLDEEEHARPSKKKR